MYSRQIQWLTIFFVKEENDEKIQLYRVRLCT